MRLFGFGKESASAQTAYNRLTLVLSHERSAQIPHIEEMQQELLQVVRKYTHTDKISVRADSNQNISTLEIEIILDHT